MTETVAAIRCVLARGSSFPSLVETVSGQTLVMKLAGGGQGARGIAIELISGLLAEIGGLRVPRATPLLLPGGLPWEVGTDEFYEAVQRSVGWNLGVAYIPDAVDLGASTLGSLSPDFLDRLAAIDALLQNVDRTAANLNVIQDSDGQPWAIDFGACLLIDRLARGVAVPRLDLPANHILAGRPQIKSSLRGLLTRIDASSLDRLFADLPESWVSELGVPIPMLFNRLRDYLDVIREM